MTFKSTLIKIAPVLVMTFLTSLPLLQTHAQMKCQEVFAPAKTSIYGHSFESYKKVMNLSELVTLLVNNRTQMNSKTFKDALAATDKAVELYLKTADIGFKKISATVDIPGFSDIRGKLKVQYSTYRLTGKVTGDENSRLLYGIQSNPKFKGQELKIIADPLYAFNNNMDGGTAFGHFSPKTLTIQVPTYSFGNIIDGGPPALRHEINHYLQKMKVHKGEMSLAREYILYQAVKVETLPYESGFAVDELESSLRDLRALSNAARNKALDTKLDSLITSVDGVSLVQHRRDTKKETIFILEHLLKKYSDVQDLFEDESVMLKMGGAADPKSGRTYAIITFPEKQILINLEVTGFVEPKDVDNQAVMMPVIQQLIGWHRARVAQIKSEIEVLKKKSAQETD